MQKIINLGPPEIAAAVFGAGDRYADAIGKAFGVHIRNARASGEDGVLIEGANEEALENAFRDKESGNWFLPKGTQRMY